MQEHLARGEHRASGHERRPGPAPEKRRGIVRGVTTCSECKENLDEVAPGERCPQCGSTRRTQTIVLPTIEVETKVFEPTLEIGENPDRPWVEKWEQVLRYLEDVEDAYTKDGKNLGNAEIRQRAIRFFNECNDMMDWLATNKTELPHLAEADIVNHVRNDPNLQICNGLADTYKPRERTRGKNPMTARVQSTTLSPEGTSVKIEYSRPSTVPQTCDALDTARKCVASWRFFFKQQGIVEP